MLQAGQRIPFLPCCSLLVVMCFCYFTQMSSLLLSYVWKDHCFIVVWLIQMEKDPPADCLETCHDSIAQLVTDHDTSFPYMMTSECWICLNAHNLILSKLQSFPNNAAVLRHRNQGFSCLSPSKAVIFRIMTVKDRKLNQLILVCAPSSCHTTYQERYHNCWIWNKSHCWEVISGTNAHFRCLKKHFFLSGVHKCFEHWILMTSFVVSSPQATVDWLDWLRNSGKLSNTIGQSHHLSCLSAIKVLNLGYSSLNWFNLHSRHKRFTKARSKIECQDWSRFRQSCSFRWCSKQMIP